MKFPKLKKVLGIVTPVACLRTASSYGVGEFTDLIQLVDLCKKCNIGLIQLLPIYDTGTDSSPYNALSAFALHPVYINLEQLPNCSDEIKAEINATKEKMNSPERFNYSAVLHNKITFAKKIFNLNKSEFSKLLENKDSEESKWVDENKWIKSYAVFKYLKRQNLQNSWQNWQTFKNPTKKEIEQVWTCPAVSTHLIFYIWLQYNLHKQLLTACRYCEKNNILLKGDLPIMVNEDSVDVWENHVLFRMDVRAGNPPDAENPEGQNWGFPIYFWENHKEDNFSWWKSRLNVASQYYNAYRLDHILGFFRIWATPEGERTASLGQPIPQDKITVSELSNAGFSPERIRWISEPHIHTEDVMAVNNDDYLNSHGELHKIADRINDEELWLFKKSIKTESDIFKQGLKPKVANFLAEKWKDRMLVKSGINNLNQPLYGSVWNYKNSTAWNTLSDFEKNAFNLLVEHKTEKSESLWKNQAMDILNALCNSVDMLACAEDLGAIPKCVPEVLRQFNILSLKVLRWERDWQAENKPFKDLSTYIEDSVTMTSVHDSSTLKQWWNEEISITERQDFLKAINCENTELANSELNDETACAILKAVIQTPSKLCCIPIQDYLTVIGETLNLTSDQRVNIPGTVTDFNWTYRIPVSIEELISNSDFIQKMNQITK